MFSLIIPTYNESENIAECIRRAELALSGIEFEILVIDDDSPDRTWEIAERSGSRQVRVVRRMGKRGLAGAVKTGFREARGEVFGVMDADLQHDAELLPQLLSSLTTHDLGVASRHVQDGSFGEFGLLRTLLSKSARRLTNAFVSTRLTDPMSGFFVIKREVIAPIIDELDELPNRDYKILLQITGLSKGLRCAEFGYRFAPRVHGESKIDFVVIFSFLRLLGELKWRGARTGCEHTAIIELDGPLPRISHKE